MKTEEIKVPLGAKDSELKGWEYTIPEGMEAIIKDGKVIVREKESEDERMCKAAMEGIEYLECNLGWDAIGDTDILDVKEYLEKQKGQKPAVNGTRTKIISRAINEKQVVLLSESNGNAEIGWDTRSLEDTKKLLEYGIAFINKQLGTKPLEWSDNFEENIRNLLHEKLKWTSDDGSMSSAVFIDDKTLKDIISGIWFYVGKEALKYSDKQLNVEQKSVEIAPNQFDGITYGMQGYSTDKPAEWSKEDSRKIGTVSAIIYDYAFLKDALDENNDLTGEYAELDNWLKSLPERFNFQSKQEWSEEDEGELQNAIDCLEYLGNRGVYASESGYDAAKNAVKFLKLLTERFNLQSNQEWSEEDDQLIGFIFGLLNDFVWRKDWAMSKEECLKRLKSLRPHPHWKPSEEQMNSLQEVINILTNLRRNTGDRYNLESLYKQLENL